MAFRDNSSGKQLIGYPAPITYNALLCALKKDRQFSITAANPAAGTITIKTGVSWKSWGENLLIHVCPAPNNRSEIFISSVSKFALVDWGKNQDNLNRILYLLSQELKNGAAGA